MMSSTAIVEVNSQRLSVVGGRVICWRLGPGVLDRCRECVYLLSLEGATAHDPAATHVVCAQDDPEPTLDLAW